MSVLEELHVAILLLEREGSFCGTMACNETFGQVSSILAMPLLAPQASALRTGLR